MKVKKVFCLHSNSKWRKQVNVWLTQTKSPTVHHIYLPSIENLVALKTTHPINIKLAMKQISVLYIASIWIPLKRVWDLIWRLLDADKSREILQRFWWRETGFAILHINIFFFLKSPKISCCQKKKKMSPIISFKILLWNNVYFE